MTEAMIVGGADTDKRKLLDLHEQYLVANGKFDWPAIEPIWSKAPHATFFNLNGHTYDGAAHWSRLWAFYIQNVKGSYWTPYDTSAARSAPTWRSSGATAVLCATGQVTANRPVTSTIRARNS